MHGRCQNERVSQNCRRSERELPLTMRRQSSLVCRNDLVKKQERDQLHIPVRSLQDALRRQLTRLPATRARASTRSDNLCRNIHPILSCPQGSRCCPTCSLLVLIVCSYERSFSVNRSESALVQTSEAGLILISYGFAALLVPQRCPSSLLTLKRKRRETYFSSGESTNRICYTYLFRTIVLCSTSSANKETLIFCLNAFHGLAWKALMHYFGRF